MRVLCIIPTLRDDPSETIESLKSQSTPPSKIIVASGSKYLADRLSRLGIQSIYDKPDFSRSLGERIASAVNAALSIVDLTRFDCILRIDADTTLPPNFIEANRPSDRIVYCGQSSLIYVDEPSFKMVMGRKFVEVNEEDTYIFIKYQRAGYALRPWNVAPVTKRAGSVGKPWKYHYESGFARYRFGYEPLHEVYNSLVFGLKYKEPK
ncbi:MAG: glycosyltransferase family A protein, partial [Nitrososphaerales archaeon]